MKPPTSLAIALALAILAALAFTLRIQYGMRDFEVYWEAGERAAEAAPLYRVEDEHYQFKYLPSFAVLFVPFARMPLAVAKAAWFGFSVALLALLIRLSLDMLPERRLRPWLLALITVVAMAKFYAHELVLGQMNLLLAGLVLYAGSQLKAGREVLAGLLLALSVVVKPYAVIFLPYLLIRRRIAAFVSMSAFLLGALALPAASYGWEGNVALLKGWLATVTGSTVPNLATQDNVSIAAMYAKWLGIGPVATGLSLLTLAALGILCVVMLKRGTGLAFPEYLEMSLLLTLIPLISPQGWDYVLLVSTPAVMCLVNYFEDLPAAFRVMVAVAVTLVAFSLYDVIGRAAYAAFMSLSVVTVCYLALIGSLYQVRAKRLA